MSRTKLRKVTAFKRWDSDEQCWTHNHIENGHKSNPEKALKQKAYRFEWGYLDSNNTWHDNG